MNSLIACRVFLDLSFVKLAKRCRIPHWPEHGMIAMLGCFISSGTNLGYRTSHYTTESKYYSWLWMAEICGAMDGATVRLLYLLPPSQTKNNISVLFKGKRAGINKHNFRCHERNTKDDNAGRDAFVSMITIIIIIAEAIKGH